MSDVFISYARSTEPQARQIGEALRALGYGVWRDDELPAHRAFSDVIEERLRAAKAVVVIWSADAVKSDWVRAEADAAREMGTLVQLRIDAAKPPMPFNRIQCADLRDWAGESETPGWRKVVASIADLTGNSGADARLVATSFAKSSEPLLAVLAFDNLSGDPNMSYFSDGVSEEILQTIAQTTKLRVIGRGSSFQFRGSDKAAAHVKRSLKATYVLDGAVRRSGTRVRISAQLIECAGETTLWSGRFERELSDIFALQDEIAESVATALEAIFTPAKTPETIDPAAYELYLRVLQMSVGNIAGDVAAAEIIRQLEEVTKLAPKFGRAWALLAGIRAGVLRYGSPTEPYRVMRAKIVEAAETALELNPGLGIAYQPLAALEAFGHYAAREALLKKALATAANDPQVLTVTGFFSGEVGRVHEALARVKRAFDLDPVQFGAAYAYATYLDFEDRYDEAKVLWDVFRAQWPESGMVAEGAIAGAIYHRDWERLDRLTEANLPEPGSASGLLWFARNLRDPDPSSLARAVGRAQKELERTGTIHFDWLISLFELGLADEAFELIARASFAYMFDLEQPWASGSRHGSVLFSVAGNGLMMRDPRFPRFCAKLGLCDYWVKTDMWPDCADQVPYDFRAEARRLAGARA
jgi:TolB-like protein